ncbi:MAG: transposase [Planctomycetes bacterium]|nr:transposase [Planctomycetota bacterium]
MNTLKHFMEKAARENSTPYLFSQRPMLHFRPKQSRCPKCKVALKVLKTRGRTLRTLPLGEFCAHETLKHCDQCENRTVYTAKDLSRMAPAGCIFGYDVLVFVGKALFLRQRQTEEIIDELLARNIRISPSEVEYLGKKFVVYLALAHKQATPRIKNAMQQRGGYVLHLDGTLDRREPVLVTGLDSISETVLGSVKLPSEKAEQIIPFLKEIKQRFGKPLATVHDMGAGIVSAVDTVFPGNPDSICHYHFLRDIGNDLLDRDYQAIRNRLRKHGISGKLQYRAKRLKMQIDQQPELIGDFVQSLQQATEPSAHIDSIPLLSAYSLIHWALAGKKQGDGYGFPFDRTQVVFAKRLCSVYSQLEPIKDFHLRGQWRDNIPLFELSRDLKKVASDRGLQKMIDEFEAKAKVFDQLRKAMRIAPAGGTDGLNSGSDSAAMGPIKKAVTKFRKRITTRSDYLSHTGYKKMIGQIDKYWDNLFADPILVQPPTGPILIQPQRTNNIMERFFRDFRRDARRKSGTNSISRTLQSMIADTPLVKNLKKAQYLQLLLNGLPSLEDRFAQIDIAAVRRELHAANQTLDRIPPKIRKVIDWPTFPAAVFNLFQKCA